MKIIDLYSGLRGWSEPWEERGHEVCAIDHDERFDAEIHADVGALRPADLPWHPDVILASPPCETFSPLARDLNYTPAGEPKNDRAAAALELVRATVRLITAIGPAFWIVENPVGKLGRLRSGLEAFDRRIVTYCQYGAPWRKPTHLWGGSPPSWTPRPACRPRASCHSPGTGGKGIQANAVRGKNLNGHESKYLEMEMPDGQGRPDNPRLSIYKARARAAAGTSSKFMLAAIRAKIPRALSLELCEAAEADHAAGRRWADAPGRLFTELIR